MSSTKQILTPAMQTCLCQIVKVSAIDDTKKDRKIRKKICKANDVNYKEFENRYDKFKSKGGMVSCPITRPSSSSEKHKTRDRSGSGNYSSITSKGKSNSVKKMKKKKYLNGSSNSNRKSSTPSSSSKHNNHNSSSGSGSSRKKSKSSIDDIFSGLSDKKKKRKREEEKSLLKEKSAKLKKKNLYAEGRSKMMPLRVDEDSGFNVYSEDALNLNKVSGGTPLCPFDCYCCF